MPLFFYLLHLPIARLTALAWWAVARGTFEWWRYRPAVRPAGYEPSLVPAYVGTLASSLLLLPVVRWFWRVKKQRRHAWLAYLQPGYLARS